MNIDIEKLGFIQNLKAVKNLKEMSPQQPESEPETQLEIELDTADFLDNNKSVPVETETENETEKTFDDVYHSVKQKMVISPNISPSQSQNIRPRKIDFSQDSLPPIDPLSLTLSLHDLFDVKPDPPHVSFSREKKRKTSAENEPYFETKKRSQPKRPLKRTKRMTTTPNPNQIVEPIEEDDHFDSIYPISNEVPKMREEKNEIIGDDSETETEKEECESPEI